MKKNTVISLFIFVFTLSMYLPAWCLEYNPSLPEEGEPIISLDFQDASLKDILKVFSMQSGLNFIASEALQDRTMTLYLDRVPLSEAMDKIFKANNLSYELDKKANIFIVKDWGKPKEETTTRVFFLKYASVKASPLKAESSTQLAASGGGGSSGGGGGSGAAGAEGGITAAVTRLLSPVGSVIEDSRTNSLIVTDIPNQMEIIAQVISSLDIRAPQVMLEVEMLDVSKNVVDKLGFDFGNNPITLIIPGKFWRKGAELFMGTLSTRGSKITDTTAAAGSVFLGSTFGELLDFLRTQTDTKYLARPRLLTLNNETAEIRIATQESVGVKTTEVADTGSTSSEPERVETGVVLRVTPQINPDTGEITMFIYPKVAEAIAGSSLTSGSLTYTFRDPEERSTKSLVRVKDGDTVVLGGLIRDEAIQVTSKLPILGDIPVLGALFRHKGGTSDKNKKRELLVFITPHILREDNSQFSQAGKVSLQSREQRTVSDIARLSTVNSFLNNFEAKSSR